MHTFRIKIGLLPSTAQWYASDGPAEPQSAGTCTRSAPEAPMHFISNQN